MLLEPGATIGTKYTVTRMLGEGGMGLVYEARHEELGVAVAIKVLRDEVTKDQEAVMRFHREARAAAALRSPHATRIIDVGQQDGRPFMVMELLEGIDLGNELERRGKLPVAEAIDYVAQACDAMAEAHALGIVHRDLKPTNLFLIRVGGRRVVKVLDFGISRYESPTEARVTQTQTAFGTPLYMSPEALRSAKHTDARSDVWAFGVILYELVTGAPPFLGETPTSVAISVTVEKPKPLTEVCPEASPELEAIVARALDKDSTRRFSDARELGDALHRLIGTDRSSVLPAEASLEPESRQPVAAEAQSQVLPAATRTGEPLSSAVRAESKNRVGLVVVVAVASLAATLSVVALLKVGKTNAEPRAGVALDSAAAPNDPSPNTPHPVAVPVNAADATSSSDAVAADSGTGVAETSGHAVSSTASSASTAEPRTSSKSSTAAPTPPPTSTATTTPGPTPGPTGAPTVRPNSPATQNPKGNPLLL